MRGGDGVVGDALRVMREARCEREDRHTKVTSQPHHHAAMRVRSQASRPSTLASSMTKTGAHSRLTNGSRQPNHSCHTGRGSGAS